MTTNPSPSNTRTCGLCGSPLSPGMNFCETCGAKIGTVPACSKCGAALLSGTRFCESCGTPVGNGLQVSPGIPAAVLPEPDPVSPKPTQGTSSPHPSPLPRKKPMSAGVIIAGIVVIALIAGIYFVGLPMFAGKGTVPLPPPTTESPPSSQNIPASSLPQVTTRPGTGSVRETSPAGSLVPGPTEQLPGDIAVDLRADKDVISGAITVMLTGGQDRLFIRDCLVTVTHPDGSMVTGTILPGNKINEVILPGSKGIDRVEVVVTLLSGQKYRVIDQLMEYAQRSR